MKPLQERVFNRWGNEGRQVYESHIALRQDIAIREGHSSSRLAVITGDIMNGVDSCLKDVTQAVNEEVHGKGGGMMDPRDTKTAPEIRKRGKLAYAAGVFANTLRGLEEAVEEAKTNSYDMLRFSVGNLARRVEGFSGPVFPKFPEQEKPENDTVIVSPERTAAILGVVEEDMTMADLFKQKRNEDGSSSLVIFDHIPELKPFFGPIEEGETSLEGEVAVVASQYKLLADRETPLSGDSPDRPQHAMQEDKEVRSTQPTVLLPGVFAAIESIEALDFS